MEKTEKKKSKLVFLIPLIALIVLVVIVAVFCLKKDEGYRLIQVYDVNGSVTLERENVGSMEAYENLNLISGDLLTTIKDSSTRLKLDDDKYVLMEEESILQLYSTGNKTNSKTNIELKEGAITVEVENKLNGDSSFEVTTPNSVMAVRGTVFRITTDIDENGKPITKVAVLEGVVTVQKKDENGKLSEEISIEDGKNAIIYTQEEEVIVLLEDVDINELP